MSTKKSGFSIEDGTIIDLKRDPICRLTENINDADEMETREILKEIEAMSGDDLSVAASMSLQIEI